MPTFLDWFKHNVIVRVVQKRSFVRVLVHNSNLVRLFVLSKQLIRFFRRK